MKKTRLSKALLIVVIIVALLSGCKKVQPISVGSNTVTTPGNTVTEPKPVEQTANPVGTTKVEPPKDSEIKPVRPAEPTLKEVVGKTISEIKPATPVAAGKPVKREKLKSADKIEEGNLLGLQGHPGNTMRNYTNLLAELRAGYESYEKSKALGDKAYNQMTNLFLYKNGVPSKEEFIKNLDYLIPTWKEDLGEQTGLQLNASIDTSPTTASVKTVEYYRFGVQVEVNYLLVKKDNLWYISDVIKK
jgi:hypothetical protein